MTSSHIFGQYDCDYMAPPPDPNGGPQLNGPCDFRGVDPPVGGNFCDPENDDPFTIRVYVHVMTRMDGTGAQSLSLIHDALNRMVRDYAPLAISFSFESLEYLPVNEDLYDFAPGDYADLTSLNYHADGIDIYFCGPGMYNNGVGGDMQDIVEGNWNLPRKASVIGGGNSEYCDHPLLITTHILSHEVGHNLGLLHTGSYNFNNPDVPNVEVLCENDLANCHCQDHVSDTGPVPENEFCLTDNCDCDTSLCPSPAIFDRNILFNIMTARAPVQCGIVFTPGQGYRIKRYLTTCDSVMQVVETGRIVIGNGFDITLEEPGIGCLPDIEIEDGGKLTVKTDLTFGEGKGIYIRKGGRLTVMGSRLSGCDGKYWKGIEVDGDPGSVQFPPDDQGFVTINSASSVRSVVEKAEFPLTVAGGGVALVRNTDFLNCGEAAFYDYPNNNISFFEGCDFLRDNGYGLVYHTNQLYLQGVINIDVKYCNFLTFTPPGTDFNGRAITGADAKFEVRNTVIDGWYSGIVGYSWGANPFAVFTVEDCMLSNNHTGVASWGLDGVVVRNNTFDGIGNHSAQGNPRGLELRNCSAFIVRDNSFEGMIQRPASIGVLAYDTGSESNFINANSFQSLNVANQAELTNNNFADPFIGLQYWCNNNSGTAGNNYDFYIYDQGISTNQGEGNATLNDFSHFNPNLGDFNNQSIGEIDYFHDISFEGTPQPGYYFDIIPIEANLPVDCNLGSGSIDELTTVEEQQLIQDFNTAKAAFQTQRATYDGLPPGSTQASLLETQMAQSKGIMHRSANRIILSELADTTGFDLPKIRTWLANKESKEAEYAIADSYLWEGDTTKTRNIRDSIPLKFSFSSTDSAEHNYYVQWTELKIGAYNTVTPLDSLDANTLVAVQNIAGNDGGRAGTQVQGLLNSAYGYSYYLNPKLPGDAQNLMIPPTLPVHTQAVSNQLITAYPNPAKEVVTFFYTLPEEAETAECLIFDLNGRLVENLSLEADSHEIQWQTGEILPGIYIYQLRYPGGVSPSFKLVVNNW